jgi:hypothetical protein
VSLSCSDPNGDPVTVNAPAVTASGLLGAVDQATQSVLYSPTKGYAGTDGFTYTATAKGVTSPPALVSIAVKPDTSVKLRIRTGTLQLTSDGRAKVKLTCPASETSGPCSGELKVRTRGKVQYAGRNRVVLLATASYSIRAGRTKAVVVKFSGPIMRLLRTKPAARQLRLVATVKDGAGNHAIVTRLATLRLP